MKDYCKNFIEKRKGPLSGKKIALFGATGGIGNELCRYILALGGTLITVDRNTEKSAQLAKKLKTEFKEPKIHSLIADLEDIDEVNKICRRLIELDIDAVIHNAGAYSIKRKICSTGLLNIYQINFASPYFITKQLLPLLEAKNGRVIAVGSIAHRYSKTDSNDPQFINRKRDSLVYGNAKRRLMYALLELFKSQQKASLALTHPGITFTNITAHYPKLIFAIIKHPMKIIFMRPKYAALSIIEGLFSKTLPYSWIGPRFFDVWGEPCLKPLKSADKNEISKIFKQAENLYDTLQKNIDII